MGKNNQSEGLGLFQITIRILQLVFLVVVIIFFILEIFYRFFPNVLNIFSAYQNINVLHQRFSSNGNTDISSAVIGIIGLLSLFGAVLAYIFNNIIKKDILENTKKDIYKLARQERDASQAEMWTTTSYILGMISDISLKTIQYCEKCKNIKNSNNDANENFCELHRIMLKECDFLGQAIIRDKRAFIKVQELDKKIYGRTIFNAKNSYAYNLAEKHRIMSKKQKEGDDPSLVFSIRDELKEAIISGEVYKNNEISEEDVQAWKETCHYVDFIFKDGEEKEKARERAISVIGDMSEQSTPLLEDKYKKEG